MKDQNQKITPAHLVLTPGLAMNNPLPSDCNCWVSLHEKKIKMHHVEEIMEELVKHRKQLKPHLN